MTAAAPVAIEQKDPRGLAASAMFIALVLAAVGGLGAPLITSVATSFHVSLVDAQWTLTIVLLTGAVATPFLGRLGSGSHRREAVIVTLTIIVAGSALTVLPFSFAVLLIGRGAQGLGLALPSLMMSVARDHLSPHRAAATIALCSVATTIGVGLSYPVGSFVAEFAGIRAAYALGLGVMVVALVVAIRMIPPSPPGRESQVDVLGAILLGLSLATLLFAISDTSLWRTHLGESLGLLGISAVSCLAWVRHEQKSKAPLVDLSLLRHNVVVGATLATFLGGIGFYLFLTVGTRYSQVPSSTGYGLGLTTFGAGLMLVPFSVFGFIAGRITTRTRTRINSHTVLATSALLVVAAYVAFGLARSNILELVIVMALLGFGSGAFSAAMPILILQVVSHAETSAAMSFNQVIRSIGTAMGSALCGLVLSANTARAREFPTNHGYGVAASIGVVLMTVTVIICLLFRTNRPPDSTVSQLTETGSS